MAKPDKLKKEIKQLKRKLDSQSTLSRKLKEEIKQFKLKLKARDKRIADLLKKTAGRKKSHLNSTSAAFVAELEKEKGVIEHKNAWKRHTYLGECYDGYLDEGYDKERARAMANQDLKGRYGEEFGFNEEQLSDILS